MRTIAMLPSVPWKFFMVVTSLFVSPECLCQAFQVPLARAGRGPFNYGNGGSTDSTISLLGVRGGCSRIDMAIGVNEPTSPKLFKFYALEGGTCPYAARTWITLLELGLPFELIEIKGMKKPDWFLDINPRGKVPAIQNLEDDSIVYESAICDEYLSDFARQIDRDGPNGQSIWKLMPVDAAERAAMRLLNDHVDTQFGPAQYTFLMNDENEKDAALIESLENSLDALQDALVARKGPYLMGKEFTLAEAHVLPFFLRLVVSLKHFKGYEIPREKYSLLLEWYELCSERESVKAAGKSDEQIIEIYQRFVDMKYGFGGLNKNQ